MVITSSPPYVSFASWLKRRYGLPVRKISLTTGIVCPNKDGAISRSGCVFCDVNESGPDPEKVGRRSVRDQLHDQIHKFSARAKQSHKFIAYLQSGSNTYGPIDRLRDIYRQAVSHPDVVSLDVSTRPDCADDDALDLLANVAGDRDVWIEFGLQSAHESTLARINRNHTFADVANATARAKARGFFVCLHLIVGLPGETRADMLATADRVAELETDAVKFHPLCVTRGSVLEDTWLRGNLELLTEDAYAETVAAMLRRLPREIIVQRISGSGRPEVHLAPDWTRDTNRTKNKILALLAV
jgi:uncharacterized protein